MKQSNSVPPANFNPWRIAGGGFLLLIVGFGIFYLIQPSTPPAPQVPPLPVDQRATAVEMIAPATGEAERDLKPRAEDATAVNPALTAPPNSAVPTAQRDADEAPFAPGGGDLPPFDNPSPAPTPINNEARIALPEKPTAAPPVVTPTTPRPSAEPKQVTPPPPE